MRFIANQESLDQSSKTETILKHLNMCKQCVMAKHLFPSSGFGELFPKIVRTISFTLQTIRKLLNRIYVLAPEQNQSHSNYKQSKSWATSTHVSQNLSLFYSPFPPYMTVSSCTSDQVSSCVVSFPLTHSPS